MSTISNRSYCNELKGIKNNDLIEFFRKGDPNYSGSKPKTPYKIELKSDGKANIDTTTLRALAGTVPQGLFAPFNIYDAGTANQKASFEKSVSEYFSPKLTQKNESVLNETKPYAIILEKNEQNEPNIGYVFRKDNNDFTIWLNQNNGKTSDSVSSYVCPP